MTTLSPVSFSGVAFANIPVCNNVAVSHAIANEPLEETLPGLVEIALAFDHLQVSHKNAPCHQGHLIQSKRFSQNLGSAQIFLAKNEQEKLRKAQEEMAVSVSQTDGQLWQGMVGIVQYLRSKGLIAASLRDVAFPPSLEIEAGWIPKLIGPPSNEHITTEWPKGYGRIFVPQDPTWRRKKVGGEVQTYIETGKFTLIVEEEFHEMPTAFIRIQTNALRGMNRISSSAFPNNPRAFSNILRDAVHDPYVSCQPRLIMRSYREVPSGDEDRSINEAYWVVIYSSRRIGSQPELLVVTKEEETGIAQLHVPFKELVRWYVERQYNRERYGTFYFEPVDFDRMFRRPTIKF